MEYIVIVGIICVFYYLDSFVYLVAEIAGDGDQEVTASTEKH